ncbi:DUF2931 family protein, partial [Enterobacter sichuanensis]|uniref:DUF2931 family protein n=1 Tax=Enterobacter sichuanensis TaxID=2071710 RepID=UPI002B1F614C
SVGTWSQHAGKGTSPFNKASSPPQVMQFCWDSIIDKKVYETTLFSLLKLKTKCSVRNPATSCSEGDSNACDKLKEVKTDK